MHKSIGTLIVLGTALVVILPLLKNSLLTKEERMARFNLKLKKHPDAINYGIAFFSALFWHGRRW